MAPFPSFYKRRANSILLNALTGLLTPPGIRRFACWYSFQILESLHILFDFE